tara:strand:- start:368 stop:1198 length:831 start_codon:yes stop_codon:yes gene_type:complete
VEKKVRDIVKPKTKGKSIVVAFGRFQPPTSGHQLLVDKVISTAKSLGAEYAMFSSRTNDPKKNPLTPRQKFKYLKRFFPDANFKDMNTIKNPVDMLYWLAEKGYDHVHLVGGEDRQGQYEAFKDLMSSTRRKDRLKLKSLTIVGAGKRDENATGVQGMSASKLRAAAAANDFKTFKSGMPRQANSSDVKDLFQDLQRGMKIAVKEYIDYSSILSVATERLIESDKKKQRANTPGQTGGFSKHNKIFPTPPCKIDEELMRWLKDKWIGTGSHSEWSK